MFHLPATSTLFPYTTLFRSYDGEYYHPNHPSIQYNQTDWKWLAGFTAKAGANFNITERMNVFVNAGYLSRTPQFSNVIDNTTNEYFEEILNENIMAFEAGYGYRSKKFSANVNGYFTYWENKPFPDRKSTRLNSSHVRISYAV